MQNQYFTIVLNALPTILTLIGVLISVLLILKFSLKALKALPESKQKKHLTSLYKIFRWILFLFTAIIFIQQIGIRLEFLTRFILFTWSVLMGALGLTFALSSYQSIQSTILAYQYKKDIPIGVYIKVGAYTGRVVEWRSHLIHLETDSGRSTLPVAYLDQNGYTILSDTDSHD